MKSNDGDNNNAHTYIRNIGVPSSYRTAPSHTSPSIMHDIRRAVDFGNLFHLSEVPFLTHLDCTCGVRVYNNGAQSNVRQSPRLIRTRMENGKRVSFVGARITGARAKAFRTNQPNDLEETAK